MLTFIDLASNYVALAVSILNNCTPERAFDLLEDYERATAKGSVRTDITPDDIEDMHKLRAQGYKYREIGEMYGLSFEEAYYKMKRRKRRSG